MKKQEVIKELNAKVERNEAIVELDEWSEGHKAGVAEALSDAIFVVKQLDEPEKVELSKAEAKWLEELKEYRGKNKYHNKYDKLYYIARAGFSHLFSFYDDNGEVELTEYKDFNDTKERLIKALLYGYEVKKEKLYTVEVPNPYDDDQRDFALYRNRDGEVILNVMVEKGWRDLDEVKLTEKEIKKNYAYLWEANLAVEVKE